MKKTLSTLLCGLCVLSSMAQRPVDAVDPLIGSGGHGHVFVGANVPYGLVQAGPTSIPTTWDWCSGYHRSDSTVIGFSQTHLSGTGIGDLFDVTVMPVVGNVTYARGTEDDPRSGLWSYADRSYEVARPGYYRTRLRRYNVMAEMTATSRVGFYRFTFDRDSANLAIVFDLENGGCWDKATDTYIEAVGQRAVRGYRYSKGWAADQKIYFYAELSENFTFDKAQTHYARLNLSNGVEKVYLKVALSTTSMAGAERNLRAELAGWDFDQVQAQATQRWNDELSRIRIETANTAQRRIFYTALYHTMIAPSVTHDVDVKTPTYSTLSLWDTYRAAHPLMTIISPERATEVVDAMVNIYDRSGKLPVWYLMGNETDCMVGNPGIPVVADAALKGLYPLKKAYPALRGSAELKDRSQDLYHKYGYIPCDKANESVAMTLEYALADWCVAEVAGALGKRADERRYRGRSHAYEYLFDPQLQFIRGKDSQHRFRKEFNPFASKHREDDYCEGNAWQYTWLVPHDVKGLVRLFGGRKPFLHKLDSLFTVTGNLGEQASVDITGLIGQYAHGNEPSHHILYLYTMLGEPNKTADKVHQVLTTLYSDQPDGLSGNEDVGQMSAWYILSSLGFYQVAPAGGRYYFGTPLFPRAEIKVKGGTFKIIAHNVSDQNRYIKAIRLNGKRYKKWYIDYKDIVAGGTLEFEMGKAEP